MAAKNTISQRITLEGADEIKRAFDALGKAGEQAFKKIQEIAEKVSPGLGGKLENALGRVKKAFDAAGKAAEEFRRRFARVQIASAQLGSALRRTATRLGLFATAVAGAVAGLGKLTKSATDSADAVGKAAQGVGLSVKAFQELEFAASQSGLDADEFVKGFNKLNVLLGEAGEGAKEFGNKFGAAGVKVYRGLKLAGEGASEVSKEAQAAQKKFTDLGVKIFDANGKLRSTEDVFKDLAQAIASIEDPAKRAAVANDFFGKTAAKWLPLILEGRAGIEALQKQFERSGLGFTDDEIASATRFNDSLSRLQKTIKQLREKGFIKFADPFRKAFDEITELVIANADKVLAIFERLSSQFGSTFQDILNALLGNDQDVKAQWVIDLRDGIIAFGAAAESVFTNIVLPALIMIKGAADLVGSSLGAIFGTEITGQAVLLTLAIGQLSGAFTVLYFAINAIIAVFAALGAWPALIIVGVAALATAIYAYWDDIVAYSQSASQSIFDYFNNIWKELSAVPEQFVAKLSEAFSLVGNNLLASWQSITDGVRSLWKGAVDYILSAVDVLTSAINNIISRIQSAINFAKSLVGLSSNDSGATKKAAGGYISGPGTSTSDSIPAWLSNGEFVIKASAVRKYGLGFLSALNGMRLPQSFNTGGLVEGLSSALMPRFADGGLVAMAAPAGGGRPINVTIGEETFSMTASDNVAENLLKYASRRRVASAGRKPSWYGA